MYWECHITIGPTPMSAKSAIELLEWKHSQIDGDPQLGKGVKQYATKNYKPTMGVVDVQHELHGVAARLEYWGWPVIREKIELVMYDTKGKVK